ncbi:MAG: hypothetical protein ACLUJG_05380 [Lawsonibacter sp.]
MEQIVRMLEKPQRYFTAHASWYGVVQTYTVSEITPFFWEDECVMFLRSLWFRLSTSEPDLIPIKPRLFLQYAPISCVPV